ncbi:hypothetical protein GQ457_09G016180 [Hibiscus cannabinus]
MGTSEEGTSMEGGGGGSGGSEDSKNPKPKLVRREWQGWLGYNGGRSGETKTCRLCLVRGSPFMALSSIDLVHLSAPTNFPIKLTSTTYSSAATTKIVWDTLVASYVRASPSYILALKSKLARNLRGSMSISNYMKDMQDIALANCHVSNADLLISIVNQLGDDYHPIVITLRVRNTPTTMLELSEILTDHERLLQESAHSTFLTTSCFVQWAHSSYGYSTNHTRDKGGRSGNLFYGDDRSPAPQSSYSRRQYVMSLKMCLMMDIHTMWCFSHSSEGEECHIIGIEN